MSITAIVTVCSEVVRHVARGAAHGPFRGIRRHVSHVSHHLSHQVPHRIPARVEIVCHAVGAGLMGAGVAMLGMTAGAALALTPPGFVADAGVASQTRQSAASGQGGGTAAPLQGVGATEPFQGFAAVGRPQDLGAAGLPPSLGLAHLQPIVLSPLPSEALPHPASDLGSPEPFPSPPASPLPPPRGDIPEPGMGLVLLAAVAGWATRRFWARPRQWPSWWGHWTGDSTLFRSSSGYSAALISKHASEAPSNAAPRHHC
jgi:hypothetical protein